MFTVTRTRPNRIDIEFGGKLDVDAMNTALDEILRETQDLENGRMLFRVGDFQLPTMGALKAELSRLPSMFGILRKFQRCALLADQEWLRTVGEFEGALIPGVDVKGFALDEEAAAEAWLAEE